MVQFWLIDYHLQCLPQSLSTSTTSVANSIPAFVKFSSPPIYIALVAQSCPTLFDPMNSSQSGSSILGIFQTRILEWVAISFLRGSSQTRDWTAWLADSLLSEPLWKSQSTCFGWEKTLQDLSVQFTPVTQVCPTLWDSTDCSTSGFPVHH